jgi:hypothetical protein
MTEQLIDTDLAVVRELSERLSDELSVEAGGFDQLQDIEDRRQRAIVSDILLASVDGLQTNLREASEHAGLLTRLAGPNGRAIPDPEHPEEIEEMQDIDRELVGFFRAAGSTLDCLGAAAIVALRIPISIRRASAESLTGLAARAQNTEGDFRTCWGRAAASFEAAAVGEPLGWFEWTLELRNAVVHRARQLRIWLPRPSSPRRPEQKLLVQTTTPPHRLMRYELHLRRSPWLADLDALSGTHAVAENWLPEPATQTVAGILGRILGLVEGVVGSLAETWEEAGSDQVELTSPAESWALGGVSQRAQVAATFEGFNPGYEVPPLTSIVTSPREAKRAGIAEALRREGLGIDEVEAQ